ncbi:hypothetical protein VTJ49DRAFT_2247 [Mycothermus thermophilus]|uniref:Uncharacterized protein n=1 Tax=Humicola insolens TaxID=85995 RepID=A0ABR3VA89_HUMIN
MTITGHKGTALGPLTTAWSMPEDCKVNVVLCPTCDEGFRGQQCVVSNGEARAEDHTRCWPPVTAAAGSPQWPFMGWGYYSPGISCPVGYTTACTAEYGGRSEWAHQFTLVPGETAIGCCPVGYRCDNRNGNTCVADADRGHTTVITTGSCVDGRMVNVGPATLPDLVTFTATDGNSEGQVVTRTRDMVLLAPMYQLNFKASDLPRATGKSSPTTTSRTDSTDNAIDGKDASETDDSADTTESTSSRPTITPPPRTDANGNTITSDTSNTNTLNPNPNAANSNSNSAETTTESSNSTGLSIGATAGIAVGAAIFSLLLAFLAWYFWQKRQKRALELQLQQQQQQQQQQQPYGDYNPDGALSTTTYKYPGPPGPSHEVEGSWPPDQKLPYANYTGYYIPPTAPPGGGPPPSELYGGYEGAEVYAQVPQELGADGLDRAELESVVVGASPVSATTETGTGTIGSVVVGGGTAGTGTGTGVVGGGEKEKGAYA